MIEGGPGFAQYRPLLAVRLGFEQLGADIAGDLQRLGHRATLSYQAGDVVRCRQIYAFGSLSMCRLAIRSILVLAQALQEMRRDYALIGGTWPRSTCAPPAATFPQECREGLVFRGGSSAVSPRSDSALDQGTKAPLLLTNAVACATEFGGTSMCRVRDALNQSFPDTLGS